MTARARRRGTKVAAVNHRMQSLRFVFILATAASLAGCYNVTYQARSRSPSAVIREQKNNFYFWGLKGQADVDLAQLCGPVGVAKVKTRQTGMNVFLGVITLGIYTPRTAFVTCATPGQAWL